MAIGLYYSILSVVGVFGMKAIVFEFDPGRSQFYRKN